MNKQFYLTQRWDPNRFYHTESEGNGSIDNEGVLHISQSSRTVASPSDGLMSNAKNDRKSTSRRQQGL